VNSGPLKKITLRLFGWLGKILLFFIIASTLIVLSLRWINPPTSSFMMQRQISAYWSDEQSFELQYDWADWDSISWTVKVAAVTSEDQRFADHWGIDLKQIGKAIEESRRGEDLRGASTITQQTAKNLFLWPGRSFFRKGLEAYFAILLELIWSKQRILEVYLNIAEFGNGIYGVQAASQHFFGTSATGLKKPQSALMVTALPSPRRYNLASPSDYMRRRQSWNLRFMNFLGNRAYLQRLE
jgi:monofunctional biosynthetic peptidoglycan transglycosylase